MRAVPAGLQELPVLQAGAAPAPAQEGGGDRQEVSLLPTQYIAGFKIHRCTNVKQNGLLLFVIRL